MDGGSKDEIIGRIDAALARVELALNPRGGAARPSYGELEARYGRLRLAVSHAIDQIDALLAEAMLGETGLGPAEPPL